MPFVPELFGCPRVYLVSNALHCMFEQKAVGLYLYRFGLRLVSGPFISRIYANFLVDCKHFSGDTLEHDGKVKALWGSKSFQCSVMVTDLNFARP